MKAMVAEIAEEVTDSPKLLKALTHRCPFCRAKLRWGDHERCIKKFWWFQGRANQRLADPELRRFILGRDGWRCRYCGCGVKMDTAHIDHLLPWSRNGTTIPQNLISSCRSCNLKKGAIEPSPADLRYLLILNRPLIERWENYEHWQTREAKHRRRARVRVE